MGIKSLIHYAKESFAKGFSEFKPSRLLTNAIENQFSIIRSIQLKPSAPQVLLTISSMSICSLNFSPIRGVYLWDENDPISFDYVDFVLQIQQEEIHLEEEKDKISITIDVPLNVQWNDIMTDFDEYCSYICHIRTLLDEVHQKVSCTECSSWMLAKPDHSYSRLKEFDLLFHRSRLDSTHKVIPSIDFVFFCLKLEFICKEVEKFIHLSSPEFERLFMENAITMISSDDHHCFSECQVICEKYIVNRRRKLHTRHIQKVPKFSSNSYSNVDYYSN